MKTATELAELFAEIEDPGRANVEQLVMVARRIRHFSQSGLIQASSQPRDKRGTEQFDVVNACAARLLSEFAGYGFNGDLLREVARCLNPQADGMLMGRDAGGKKFERPFWGEASEENTVPPSHHVAHLPGNLLAGEAWELRLYLMLQFSHRSISGKLCRVGDEQLPHHQAFLHQGIERVGLITLCATRFCKPLIDAYGA